MKPHIPLGHRENATDEGKTDVGKPRKASRADDQDPSLYYIYDENDKPLVIDLQAIDECQRLRGASPFEAPSDDDGPGSATPAA